MRNASIRPVGVFALFIVVLPQPVVRDEESRCQAQNYPKRRVRMLPRMACPPKSINNAERAAIRVMRAKAKSFLLIGTVCLCRRIR